MKTKTFILSTLIYFFTATNAIATNMADQEFDRAIDLVNQGKSTSALNLLLETFEKRDSSLGYLKQNRNKTNWYRAYEQIATMYQQGIGTNVDRHKALEFYSVAAGDLTSYDKKNKHGKYDYLFRYSNSAAINACFLAKELMIFHKQYKFCRPFSFSLLRDFEGAQEARLIYDSALSDPDPTIRLIRAISIGKYDIAKNAIDDGARINQEVSINLVRKLPHIKIKKTTAFWEAFSSKNIKAIRLLVTNGADVNWMPSAYKNNPRTVLGNLAGETYIGKKIYPHWDIAEVLLKNGYIVREQDIESISNLVRINTGAKKKMWSDRLERTRNMFLASDAPEEKKFNSMNNASSSDTSAESVYYNCVQAKRVLSGHKIAEEHILSAGICLGLMSATSEMYVQGTITAAKLANVEPKYTFCIPDRAVTVSDKIDLYMDYYERKKAMIKNKPYELAAIGSLIEKFPCR